MKDVLSYKTLLEFIKQKWEQNGKHPSLEINRDEFIARFGDVSFVLINRFLHDLDKRYHALRVTDYAYSEKWEDEKYMDMSAVEIAEAKNTETRGKNIEAISRTTLTTSLVVEPDFLNVLESFNEPWELKASIDSPIESLVTAKLKLKGRALLLDFEGRTVEVGVFDSTRRKGYQVCKSLLAAKGDMLPKDGLTGSILNTSTTQLPKLLKLEPALAKIFYRYTKSHAALNYKVELNKPDAKVVRAYVNSKMRQNRDS